MGDLRISVGDLNFSARWEANAPRTREALRSVAADQLAADPLPLERRVDLDPVRRPAPGRRLRERHLAPRARGDPDLRRRHQRVRDPVPVRRLQLLLQGRPAGRQPLRHAGPRRGVAGPAARSRTAGAVAGRAGRHHRGNERRWITPGWSCWWSAAHSCSPRRPCAAGSAATSAGTWWITTRTSRSTRRMACLAGTRPTSGFAACHAAAGTARPRPHPPIACGVSLRRADLVPNPPGLTL